MTGVASRDEREVAIDNAADRLAYGVVSYGLLVVVAWRSFVHGEAPWDLLALVILGGAVGTVYRLRMRAVTRSWVLVAAAAAVLAAAVAVALVFLTR